MYALIETGGSDSLEFLQGQLTQDVGKLDETPSLPAAWCNAKGRVITLVRLLRLPHATGLVVPASLVDDLIKRLTMYRLRSDVSIEHSKANWSCKVFADPGEFARLADAALLPDPNGACNDDGLVAVDFSGDERFVEVYGTADAYEKAGLTIGKTLSDEQHATLKIRAGIAAITPENTEKYTPHMLNLDRLGAVSFDKGCYTGQEVVARTENLGESKRRLRGYRCEAAGIAIGDKLSHDGRDVGTVVNVQGTELLAVTPVALHEQPLTLNSSTATPSV